MDYEKGLEQLKQHLHGTVWEHEFQVYEARLRENLTRERLYGTSEQFRSDRAQIIGQLNRLASYVGTNFNDLCLNRHIPPSAPSPDPAQLKVQTQTPSATPSPNPARTKVFISYSHKDREFLDRLKVHLAPEIRDSIIDEWDDTSIKPGERWRTEIDQAIQSTRVAILLVSADFLASKFIATYELPPLLDTAQSGNVTILPVLVKQCRYKTVLGEIQFVNNPLIQLIQMPEWQQEEIWTRVADRITEILSATTNAQTSGPQPDNGHTNNTPIDTERPSPVTPETKGQTGKHILIASLGESPVVVSSMYYKLLKEQSPIKIDRTIILYPEDDEEVLAAYNLIRDHLSDKCEVVSEGLPFKDVDSWLNASRFLQRLYKQLRAAQGEGARVYLSLAGGRKSMAALMAWVAPLFPCVQHLYHIIDENKKHFLSAKYISALPAPKQGLAMRSAIDQLLLVDIPFDRGQIINPQIQNHLLSAAKNKWNEMQAEAIEDAMLVQAITKEEKLLDVWVTKLVADQFSALCKNDVQLAIELQCSFERMCLPSQLHDASSSADKLPPKSPQLQYFQNNTPSLRIFFYKKSNKDNASDSDNQSEQIIVCAFDVAVNGKHKKLREIKTASSDFSLDPYCTIGSLPPVPYAPQDTSLINSILIVPLGNRPMIATQLFEMLSYQGKRHIHEVYLVYPKESLEIDTSAEFVESALKTLSQKLRRNIICSKEPVKDLSDITSKEHCEIYQKALETVIDKAHDKYPGYKIDLALSGGRKGMTAMTIFAAQRKGIRHVYHTLITNDDLNDKIDKETGIDALDNIADDEKRANLLFLRAYNKGGLYKGFALFPVPVFPASEEH
jgi:CRISPR-associated Csx14 family protein